jgi:hypothetical protein
MFQINGTWSSTCHLPNAKGGLGVTFNDVPKDDAFYSNGHHPVSVPP